MNTGSRRWVLAVDHDCQLTLHCYLSAERVLSFIVSPSLSDLPSNTSERKPRSAFLPRVTSLYDKIRPVASLKTQPGMTGLWPKPCLFLASGMIHTLK